MSSNIKGVYHPRDPTESPLWNLLNNHYESFEKNYEEKFKKKYGYFRPVIKDVVEEYLRCGDLKEGFARVRCSDCGHEYLLAFSCKGRWFCPACHMKKVIQFGDFLNDNILYPIPHRQYVFTMPIRLRLYFKHDRQLLSKLCRCAYESLLEFFRITTGMDDGVPGMVMTIHTFGDYPDKYHPHIHALVSNGLFTKKGMFYVTPDVDTKPLLEIFQAKLLKMLKKEGKINDAIIDNILSWRHSGFSIDNGRPVARDDGQGKIAIAQYIIRNSFSLEKLVYNEDTGMVIYHSKMTYGKEKKNFKVYTAEEFIAAITQHIPEKSFQMVRYYGFYSSKARGIRHKHGIYRPGDEPEIEITSDIEVIDVSEYKPLRIPSKTWRECIKKIWDQDPLCCPNCGGTMRLISFITESKIIRKILKHLGLWKHKPSRDPPAATSDAPIIYEIYEDLSAEYEEPYFSTD